MWLLMAAALAAEIPPQSNLPSWMSGCWELIDGDRWTEECWTGVRAAQMMGSSRTGKGEMLEWYEHTRITSAGGVTTYCALPKGQSGGCFNASKVSENEIVFENEAHDFPQRIRYWREGTDLLAEISLKDGKKAQRWRYAPMGN